MESRNYKGYWWLPSSSEDKVSGTLTIHPDGSLVLELFGGFSLEDEDAIFKRRLDKIIYGRCYAPNGHMKDITLFECSSSIQLNFSSNFPITRYTCRYALIGIHVKSQYDPSFFEAHINFEELAYWCPPKNITTSFSDSSITTILDTNKDHKTLAKLTLNDGIVLNLNQGCSYRTEYPKIFIEQSTYLEVKKEGLSCQDILSTARKFERFLSLTMLFPVEHGIITLRSRDCSQTMNNEDIHYHPIEFVTFLYKGGEKSLSGIKRPDMLFEFKDVSDRFEVMYNRFHSDLSIAQIWSNLIDCLEKKRVFTSNDFLVVAQALDGFAIRFRKEQNILSELQALKEEFSSIQRLNLTEDDLKEAKDSRNYYSHILKLEKKEQKLVQEGVNLYNLTSKLRVLLICCILDFLGFEKDKINELLNKCNNSLLRN